MWELPNTQQRGSRSPTHVSGSTVILVLLLHALPILRVGPAVIRAATHTATAPTATTAAVDGVGASAAVVCGGLEPRVP